MDCCDDRSAISRSTASLPLFVLISRCPSSPLARSRQTMTTVAHIRANPSAVAFPMPELAPVIRQTFPCIPVFNNGMVTLLTRGMEWHLLSLLIRSICSRPEALHHNRFVFCYLET